MNKYLTGAAVALTLALPTTAYAQRAPDARVVVVDTSRVFRECTACLAAQPQLQALVQQAQQRSQQLGQPLQAEMQSLEQAAAAARNQTGAARTATEAQLQQRLQALQVRETTANRELAQLEQNIRSTQAHVLQQINQRLNPAINQVMTQRGANLALDTDATLARASALDVTNDVLAALNAALPAVSVTPLPQPAPAAQPATPPQPTGR